MKTKKLSKTQQELLDAMKSGVVVRYMAYRGRMNPNPYYWRNDNHKRVTAAANALIAKGFAKDGKRDYTRDCTLELIDQQAHTAPTDSPDAR